MKRRTKPRRPTIHEVMEAVVQRVESAISRLDDMHKRQLEFLKETREITETTLARELAVVHARIDALEQKWRDAERPRMPTPGATITPPPAQGETTST